MRLRSNILLSVIAGLSIGVGTWFALLRPASGASQDNKRPVLSQLPPIKSCVQHIKVVKAELVNQGDSQAAVLELENEAFVGVVSISVEQISHNGKNSVVSSAFQPDKPPLVVIPPGDKKTLILGNLESKSVIRIGGVMFSDGTEEGCESSLKAMRKLKDHHLEKGGSR